MNKIILLQGLPLSGKSTKAKEIYNSNPKKYTIVNRDSIRLGRGDYWIPEQENYITQVEEFSVISSINLGLIPIIDATNLNPKTLEKWENLAKEHNSELEIIKMPYIPISEAFERNNKRKEEGGICLSRKDIERFYKTYYKDIYIKEIEYDICTSSEPNLNLPLAVIFDLDKTIMFRRGRGIYDYEQANTDYFDPKAKYLIEHWINNGINILFVTGREITENSLNAIYTALNIPKKKTSGVEWYPFEVFGRQVGDHRKGVLVKEEIYETKIKDKYDVLVAFDDDREVIEMYKTKGIFCV